MDPNPSSFSKQHQLQAILYKQEYENQDKKYYE